MRVPLFALILAVFVWRNGRTTWNFFSLSDYPVGYYAGGDWNEHCEIVKDEPDHAMNYCEDATFWDHLDSAGTLKERFVLLSCDPNRKAWNTVMGPLADPDPFAALWLYAPKNPQSKPQRVTFKGYPKGHDFHPLGLEIYPAHGSASSNLFVVNHARERTVVEQFTLSPATPTVATWVRTISHKYFISPNALALTSPTSFYVSNDHLLTRRLPSPLGNVLPMIESVLALPFGWLAHVSVDPLASGDEGVNHTFAAFGVPFANGVALSPDGTTVALSATSHGRVNFYDRDPQTDALTYRTVVHLPFTPDNIMFDDEGTLITAGHPHFPSLINVAANKSDVAPSWVTAVSPRTPVEVGGPSLGAPPKEYDLRAPVSASSRAPSVLSHEVETLFQSNGTAFSSSATGLRDSTSGVLYVTGLYQEGLLVCKP